MFFPAVNLCDRASGLFSRSKIWCESYSDTCFIFVLICSPVFRNKRRLDLLHPPRSLWLEKNVSSVLSTSSFFFAVFSSREVKGSNVLCGLMDRSGFPVKYTSVMTFFFFSSKWLFFGWGRALYCDDCNVSLMGSLHISWKNCSILIVLLFP